MAIPRERVATGEYLTRLYVQVPGVIAPGDETRPSDRAKWQDGGRAQRAQVTLGEIFEQAQAAFRPYYVRTKRRRLIGGLLIRLDKGLRRCLM
ncbi:hypothetical protein BDV29DRAFT_124663 [Aspergillus leporis]|uniref:Uncharacterized protein n=1 Tax=Aspergillus leporis TaxID=41062 RepID=A0A5N5X2S5_9EURO|nr:hypothetical protein BDV29DRAFT_124663 [Aspergillus leporis]